MAEWWETDAQPAAPAASGYWWESDPTSDAPASIDTAVQLGGPGAIRPDAMGDVSEQALRAAAHWGTDLLGTPIDLLNLGHRATNWLERKVGLTDQPAGQFRGGSADLGRWFTEPAIETVSGLIGHPISGATPEPATPEGRLARSVVSAANPLPFLATPARIPLAMAAGGATGAALEGAQGLGLPDPVNVFLALLAGGATDALGGMLAPRGSNLLTPTAGRVVRDTLSDVTPAQLAEARRVQDAGGLLGVPLTFAESVGTQGLLGLAGDVGTSRQGAGLLDTYFNDRIRPMADAFNASIDQFGPRPTPGAAADAAQTAADNAVGALRGARSGAASPLYQAADPQHVAAADVQQLIDQLDQMNPGRGTALEAEIQRFRNSLLTGREIDPNTGLPPVPDPITGTMPPTVPEVQTLIEPLADIYRTFRGRMELPMVARDAIDSVIGGRVGPINDQLRAILEGNPDFAAGQATYRAMSPAVTAAERSPVGTIATAGRDVGPPRIEAMINAFTNPKAIRPQDITFTAQALGASNPAAFRGLVQVFMENALSEALQDGSRGQPSNIFVGSAVQDVLGKPGTMVAANTEQMLREMAVPAGLNPDDVIAGWRDLMTIFDRTGRTPGMGSRTEMRGELRAAAGNNLLSAGADFASASPLNSFSKWVRDRTMRGAYRDIAAALVAPDSLAAMADLARTGRWSPATAFWVQQATGINSILQQPQ